MAEKRPIIPLTQPLITTERNFDQAFGPRTYDPSVLPLPFGIGQFRKESLQQMQDDWSKEASTSQELQQNAHKVYQEAVDEDIQIARRRMPQPQRFYSYNDGIRRDYQTAEIIRKIAHGEGEIWLPLRVGLLGFVALPIWRNRYRKNIRKYAQEAIQELADGYTQHELFTRQLEVDAALSSPHADLRALKRGVPKITYGAAGVLALPVFPPGTGIAAGGVAAWLDTKLGVEPVLVEGQWHIASNGIRRSRKALKKLEHLKPMVIFTVPQVGRRGEVLHKRNGQVKQKKEGYRLIKREGILPKILIKGRSSEGVLAMMRHMHLNELTPEIKQRRSMWTAYYDYPLNILMSKDQREALEKQLRKDQKKKAKEQKRAQRRLKHAKKQK